MDGKGSSAEVSDGSEEHVIRHWRKGHPYYWVAKNLAELYLPSGVLWKVELANEDVGSLAEDIYKQRVERVACLVLTSSKILEARNDLKMDKLSKKKREHKDLKKL